MGETNKLIITEKLLCVYISSGVSVGVYLVKNIIEALVQILQVQQDDSSTNLHTNLDLVNIATHLRNIYITLLTYNYEKH